MSAAERILLEGKDWFREPEAAEYAGLSVDEFRGWYPTVGVSPRRVGAGKRGRKLYSRHELNRAIESSPAWQPSTLVAPPSTSAGPKVAAKSDSLLAGLRPARQREYAPRKRQN